jgi:hypothetical protein
MDSVVRNKSGSALTRSCNGCTSCCYGVYPSTGLPTRCELAIADKGCAAYELRPAECREFFCRWVTDPSVPEELFPRNSHMVILGLGKGPVVRHEPGYKVSQAHMDIFLEWARALLHVDHQPRD